MTKENNLYFKPESRNGFKNRMTRKISKFPDTFFPPENKPI